MNRWKEAEEDVVQERLEKVTRREELIVENQEEVAAIKSRTVVVNIKSI
jgi:hypothetical protein